MATKGIISHTCLSLALIVLISNLFYTQPVRGIGDFGRMSNHFFFRGRAPVPNTTQRNDNDNNNSDNNNNNDIGDKSGDDGASVPVQDKASLPAPSFPNNSNSFMDSLLNRDTYFDMNSQNTNSGKDNQGANNNNAVESNTEKGGEADTTTVTTTTTTTTTTPKPTTTTTTTSPTKTAKPTTATSTATTTTPAKGGDDSDNNNDSNNNSMLNPDGTVNKDRPTLLEFPTSAQEQNRDRQLQMQAADLILAQMFNRPSLLTGPVSDRGRVPDPDDSKLPFTPVEEPATVLLPIRIGAIVINPDGSVSIAANEPNSETSTTTTTTTTITASNNNNNAGNVDEKNQGEPTTKGPDVQDKPFYGVDDSIFADPNDTGDDPEEDAGDDGETTDGDYEDDDNVEDDSSYNVIRKRSVSFSVQDRLGEFGDDSVDDLSCYQPLQFSSCEYYSRCFSELDETCTRRDSFIGDDVRRFCLQTEETIATTESTLLSTYLKTMQKCVSFELSQILEGASCDDVTVTLMKSLLLRNSTSCLYLNGLFCDVIDDPEARPGLARMVMKPTEDPDFMMRLLVNIGDMSAYCRGAGGSIFVTDLMFLATTKNSPFTLPKPPIPGFSP